MGGEKVVRGRQLHTGGLKVHGKQLRKALREVDGDLVKQMKDVHQTIAEWVAIDAARNAPEDSGDLRAELHGKGTQTRAYVRTRGGPNQYAGIQEWGDPGRGIAAQEFTMRAAQENASDILAYLVRKTAAIGRSAGFDVRK